MKKKLLLLLLMATCICTFTACGNTPATNNTNTETNAESNTEETAVDISAVDALQKAWELIPEDQAFPCFGGTIEANVENGAGAVPLDDENIFVNTLLIPSEVVEKATEAASLMHMMNSNTFTGGSIKLDGIDAGDAATKIKDTFKNNQFMCGIPEKIKLATVGNVVVYAYGDSAIVDLFMDKVVEADGATIIIDENY